MEILNIVCDNLIVHLEERREKLGYTFNLLKEVICYYTSFKWMRGIGACLQAGQPGFNPECQRVGDFPSLLCVQTGPEVHL